jgi:peptidoglycan biosynthesis protein MviN/MurJ (putative lipid II flippase)
LRLVFSAGKAHRFSRMPDQQKTDAKHLLLLSIFHFVGAAFAVLGILFLLVHYAIFQAVFANPKMWENSRQGPPPEAIVEMFKLFKWFYLFFGIWFLASGILNLISGFYIRARKHRMFSLIVAGMNCLHVPFGTALGVFTIIVLTRDSVVEAYDVH